MEDKKKWIVTSIKKDMIIYSTEKAHLVQLKKGKHKDWKCWIKKSFFKDSEKKGYYELVLPVMMAEDDFILHIYKEEKQESTYHVIDEENVTSEEFISLL